MSYVTPHLFDTAYNLTVSSGDELSSNLVTTVGLAEIDDGEGGIFAWSPTSLETDDGINVIQPTSVSGAGRWLRVSGQPTATADFTVPITVTAASGNDTAIVATGHGSGDGVDGYATSGAGIFGQGTSGYGGYFQATTGKGVYGYSDSAYGVEGDGGVTGAGIHGIGGATSGAGGVFTATGGNSDGVTATGHGSKPGITATGGATGAGVEAYAGGAGVTGIYAEATTGIAVNAYANGAGSAVSARNDGGRALIVTGDPTSPVLAAFRLVPQDNVPSGDSLVGDMYVTTAGLLKICTVAGTGGGATWVSVGAQ